MAKRTERERMEAKVWTMTHRDFRGKLPDGTKMVLRWVAGLGTCSVPVSSLTEEELLIKYCCLMAKLPK